jgi:hypothetical protein
MADRLRWLVLVHHLPAQPNYLRVKIGRRLESVGALAVKGSVYCYHVLTTLSRTSNGSFERSSKWAE